MDELIVRLYQKITGHKKIHAHIQIFYNMCLCACTSKKKFLNPFYHLLLVFLLLPFTIPLLRLLPKSQCFSFHTGIDFFQKSFLPQRTCYYNPTAVIITIHCYTANVVCYPSHLPLFLFVP